jgi:aquaporin TIP
MDQNVRAYLAELIGTFALVFLSAGTVVATQLTLGAAPPQSQVISIALAEGFILAAALSATINVSGGYLNPAITLMLWVYKRMEGARAGWLIGVQLIGAVLAGLCLRVTFTEDVLAQARLGTPHLNLAAFGGVPEGLPTIRMLLSGIGIEVVLTFILTFAIFGTIIDPRGPRLGGLAVGLTLTASVFMGYAVTGAATNPARWFGPAIWELTIQPGALRDHAVYWIGPIVGALLAGGIYTYLILPAEKAPAAPVSAVPASTASTLIRTRK